MTELLILFGVGLGTGLSGAMVPGPLTLYTVSEAFDKGQTAGLKIALGHLLLEAAFVGLVVMGLRDFLSSAAFRTLIAWIGGMSLVVMGILLLAQLRSLSLAPRGRVSFRWGPVAGGAFFSLVSPGFVLWWATIGTPIFLEGLLAGPPGAAMVSIGHAMADLVWCWFVAFSVERGKAYCTDRTYRLIMGAMAAWLIVLGIGFPVKHLMAW